MSDLYDRRLHGIAVYNPDLLSKEELMAQFVARRPLLDQLLGELSRPRFNQHQMIVGHRGMGKTTLLRMIRFAIESDEKLSKIWLPLTFPEEQYNVRRLSDFYVNCADAMSDALESRGRRADADALDAAIAALARTDEERRTTEALDLVRNTAERLGMKLLLLVDNFELITERLKKEEASLWALREVLSRERWLLLIAASPVVMGAAQTYDAPFYDFFHTHELHALTIDETKELLRVLAVERNEPHVATLVESDPARIETLHTLAGGNPRTMVLLFGVLSQGADGDVRTDLERLLDICTPLYKSRFEELPAQAQQVIDALAVHWDPISAGELAEQLRLDVNSVSSQLNRLAQQGVVEKVEYDPETKTGFQVAERFFNIWYLMRASRRLRKRLTWLVQFLKLFFGAEHLVSRASTQLRRGAASTSDSRLRDAEFCFALADALPENRPLKLALEYRAMEALLSDRNLRAKVASVVDVEADAGLVEVMDRQQWATDFADAVNAAKLPASVDREHLLDLLGGSSARSEEKLRVARNLSAMSEPELTSVLASLEARDRSLTAVFGRRTAAKLRLARRKGYIENLEEEGFFVAIAALDAPELLAAAQWDTLSEDDARDLAERTDDAHCWHLLAVRLERREAFSEAEAAYRQALALDPDFAFARFTFANLLAALHRPEEGEAVLLPAMERLGTIREAHLALGYLQYEQERFADAAASFREALRIKPEDAEATRDLADALSELGQDKEAILLLENATIANPAEAVLWMGLIAIKGQAEGSDEAVHVALSAMEKLPMHAGVHGSAARWLLLAGNYAAALPPAELAAAAEPSARHFATLATSLIANHRWSEAADHVRNMLSKPLSLMTERQMRDYELVFGMSAKEGFGEQVGRLMDESDAGERLRPFREALRFYGRGQRSGLRKLAPEVRTATREILKRWDTLLPQRRVEASKTPRRKARQP